MKATTLENLNKFWSNAKKEANKSRVIYKSANNPIESYGKDGDVWIVHESPDVLISITYNGTTVYPVSNKDYLGVFSNTSECINELDGAIICTTTGVAISSFSVSLKPGFTYKFIDYNTGEEDKTVTLTSVSGVPTGLLEVTHSKSLKKYLYKIVGSASGGSYAGDQ